MARITKTTPPIKMAPSGIESNSKNNQPMSPGKDWADLTLYIVKEPGRIVARRLLFRADHALQRRTVGAPKSGFAPRQSAEQQTLKKQTQGIR